MAEFITLTCPTCGGTLKLTEDIDRFACSHCGNEHVVKRGDGIIFLKPIVGELSEIRSSVNKAASEMAINRLLAEINSLQKDVDGLDEEIEEFDSQLQVAERRKNLWIAGIVIFAFLLCSTANTESTYCGGISLILIIVSITNLFLKETQ
jgi:hypothetical protein